METIMRLDPANPIGEMTRAPPLPLEILESGSPQIDNLPYYKDPANGISTGMWKATPFTSKLRPYGTHEFILLIEGELILIDPNGTETVIAAPNMVVVPKGLLCRWKQVSTVRKIYMILSGDSAPSPLVSPVSVVIGGPLDSLPIGADGVRRASKLSYSDPSGRFRVGQWESSAFKSDPVKASKHELMHILEGELTLAGPDGENQRFIAGETVFMPFGTPVSWNCPNYVRKIFCTFAPN